uniref:KIB1-4 beta-propeller domain-containing protein n=1 Tax=Oryza barthii TaxID=65489 RepID=A0A0D3GC08_9ORYZ
MAEEDINKMMSSDGEISSMAERAASLLRQLIEDGCAAAKPLAEMVEYCAKHAADEAQVLTYLSCAFSIAKRSGYCLVVDVFTGAEVSPPRLPFSKDHEEIYFCGTLTAPITSPNSHLLISNRSSLFDWPVGSDSWSELKLPVNRVDQIVEFNGQLIAVIEYKLYTLQLAPKLRLKKMKTLWWDDMSECPYLRPWLVVCDGMLLIVDHYITLSFGAPVNYRPYRLDMSAKPAKWVEVKKLENWALFIGGDARSPPFAFKNPERWGGRSNCLYYAHYSQPWSLHGLGDDADAVWDPTTDDNLVFKRNWYSQLQAFWVYPSMFYSDGDGQ